MKTYTIKQVTVSVNNVPMPQRQVQIEVTNLDEIRTQVLAKAKAAYCTPPDANIAIEFVIVEE